MWKTKTCLLTCTNSCEKAKHVYSLALIHAKNQNLFTHLQWFTRNTKTCLLTGTDSQEKPKHFYSLALIHAKKLKCLLTDSHKKLNMFTHLHWFMHNFCFFYLLALIHAEHQNMFTHLHWFTQKNKNCLLTCTDSHRKPKHVYSLALIHPWTISIFVNVFADLPSPTTTDTVVRGNRIFCEVCLLYFPFTLRVWDLPKRLTADHPSCW